MFISDEKLYHLGWPCGTSTASFLTPRLMRLPVFLSTRTPNLASICTSFHVSDERDPTNALAVQTYRSVIACEYLDVGVMTMLEKKLADSLDHVVHDICTKESKALGWTASLLLRRRLLAMIGCRWLRSCSRSSVWYILRRSGGRTGGPDRLCILRTHFLHHGTGGVLRRAF